MELNGLSEEKEGCDGVGEIVRERGDVNRIKVIDSFTGSGKTTFAINYINSLDDDTRIIYITPFLSECDRIIENCSRKFVQPNVRSGKGRKMDHLINLVSRGVDIVSTHALFSNIDERLINALKANNYILFLDETMSVIESFDLYKWDKMMESEKEETIRQDIINLKKRGLIDILDDYSIKWIDDDIRLGKYQQFKNLADRRMLYFINDSLLIWSFPIDVFRDGIFSEIFILTYLFDHQIQSLYYDYFDLDYSIYHIEKINNRYEMVFTENDDHDVAWRKQASKNITIMENKKINNIGSWYQNVDNVWITSGLSKSWFTRNPNLFNNLTNNIVGFFQYHTKSKSHKRLWTCFKSDVKKLACKNLSGKHWLEISSRATNDYCDRNVLAYCVNRYPNPFFEHFFKKKGIEIDKDRYALSEMIQWIWRSAIRNDEPITIYIPSQRMRELLKKWLLRKEIVPEQEQKRLKTRRAYPQNALDELREI